MDANISKLYQLGWTHSQVIVAVNIIKSGTDSQRNKLASELLPRLRNLTTYSTHSTGGK